VSEQSEPKGIHIIFAAIFWFVVAWCSVQSFRKWTLDYLAWPGLVIGGLFGLWLVWAGICHSIALFRGTHPAQHRKSHD